MSVNGASNSSSKVNLNEIAKNVGTGPTPLEKEIANKVKKCAKEAINDVANFMKTPQAKVITTGVLITPLIPVVGMGIALGGAALSALKALDNMKDSKQSKDTDKDFEKLKEGAEKASNKINKIIENAKQSTDKDKNFEKLKEGLKNNSEDLKDAAVKGIVVGATAGTVVAGPLGILPGALTGAAVSTTVESIKKMKKE